MGRRYEDGQEEDGRIIPCPVDPNDPDAESIIFQRHLNRDMKTHGAGAYAMMDPHPNLAGRRMTIGDVFDDHARVMLVMAEIEARAAKKSP